DKLGSVSGAIEYTKIFGGNMTAANKFIADTGITNSKEASRLVNGKTFQFSKAVDDVINPKGFSGISEEYSTEYIKKPEYLTSYRLKQLPEFENSVFKGPAKGGIEDWSMISKNGKSITFD